MLMLLFVIIDHTGVELRYKVVLNLLNEHLVLQISKKEIASYSYLPVCDICTESAVRQEIMMFETQKISGRIDLLFSS